MDPSPRPLRERATDPELGVPLPFACDGATYDPSRGVREPSIRHLDKRRVTQCALSRVCGVCGAGLGRPLAFLGSRREADRNAFHFPPCHLDCARELLDLVDRVDVGLLGHPDPVESWVLTTTAAFEFVRPGREDEDQRPTFQPYEVLSTTT